MDVMGLVSGIGQAVGIYKTAVDTLDQAQIAAATNELNVKLIQLGAEVLAMQKDGLQATERERAHLRRVHDLEDKVRELEKRISDRERYDLVEEYTGVFTLRLKEESRNGEPMHYLCAHCMDNKAVKSILQFAGGQKELGSCPECKSMYRFQQAQRARNRATGYSV